MSLKLFREAKYMDYTVEAEVMSYDGDISKWNQWWLADELERSVGIGGKVKRYMKKKCDILSWDVYTVCVRKHAHFERFLENTEVVRVNEKNEEVYGDMLAPHTMFVDIDGRGEEIKVCALRFSTVKGCCFPSYVEKDSDLLYEYGASTIGHADHVYYYAEVFAMEMATMNVVSMASPERMKREWCAKKGIAKMSRLYEKILVDTYFMYYHQCVQRSGDMGF